MDLASYFQSITYIGTQEVSIDNLLKLHQRHMFTFPFENLDVLLKRPIQMNGETLFQKMVLGKRGGFCYEQNTLFGLVLKELGYQVEFISARVWKEPDFGRDREHIALLVSVNSDTYLADVGFGDSFLEPMRFIADLEQEIVGKRYRLIQEEEQWIIQEHKGEKWENGYAFDPSPLELDDFAAMCEWTQTSPESSFTQRMVCSKATDYGRVTLRHNRLIITRDGVKAERPIESLTDLQEAFIKYFQMNFSEEELKTLMVSANHVS